MKDKLDIQSSLNAPNIKDIIIDIDICIQTFPCIHPVIILYKNGSSYQIELDNTDIHKMLVSLGKEIPSHFEEEDTPVFLF